MTDEPNGWEKWSKYVLGELKEIKQTLREIHDAEVSNAKYIEQELSKNRVEIAQLKVKAGAWGVLGGLIPAVGLLLAYVLKGL